MFMVRYQNEVELSYGGVSLLNIHNSVIRLRHLQALHSSGCLKGNAKPLSIAATYIHSSGVSALSLSYFISQLSFPRSENTRLDFLNYLLNHIVCYPSHCFYSMLSLALTVTLASNNLK